MKFKSIKEAVQFRINSDDYIDETDEYKNAAIEIYINNINEFIKFIENDCSDEEFFWLSDMFEEIVKKTKNGDLINAARSRLAKINAENYNQNNFINKFMRDNVNYDYYVRDVNMDIDYAEGQLEADN